MTYKAIRPILTLLICLFLPMFGACSAPDQGETSFQSEQDRQSSRRNRSRNRKDRQEEVQETTFPGDFSRTSPLGTTNPGASGTSIPTNPIAAPTQVPPANTLPGTVSPGVNPGSTGLSTGIPTTGLTGTSTAIPGSVPGASAPLGGVQY